MLKICLTFTATLAVVAAMIGGRSHAAVMDPDALRVAADELGAVELVQFTWRGRNFCWYNTGWRGPGWYQCGFRWRRGSGWGGPLGWHGWRRPGIRVGQGPNRPGINRPGGNRPGINRPGGNRPSANRPGGRSPSTTGQGGNRPSANRPGGRPPSTTGQGGNRPGGGSRGRNRGGGRS